MPDQKNCVPSVAMKEGMPIFATSRPLMKPTSTPEASAATTAIQPSPYSLNSTANTKPEKAMIDGKAEVDLARADHEGEPGGEQHQRRQRREEGGVDIGRQEHLRRRIHEQASSSAKTTMIGSPFDTRCRIDAPAVGHSAVASGLVLQVDEIFGQLGTVMSFGTISATISPRSSTTSRSATSCTCARLCSM